MTERPVPETLARMAGLSQIPASVRERPLEKSERAELLKRLGRGNEARPLINQLTAMGYRGST